MASSWHGWQVAGFVIDDKAVERGVGDAESQLEGRKGGITNLAIELPSGALVSILVDRAVQGHIQGHQVLSVSVVCHVIILESCIADIVNPVGDAKCLYMMQSKLNSGTKLSDQLVGCIANLPCMHVASIELLFLV